MANIIEATDPRGRVIQCTSEQWQNHVIGKHSELTGREEDVSQAVQSPLYICSDADFADREVYYSRKIGRTLYLKVIVRFKEGNAVGQIITAFYTDGGKSGEQMIWPGSQS
jgi:hypothetical protein